MSTLVHFDIPSADPERSKKFYTTIFGWKFLPMPGDDSFHLIQTTDQLDRKGPGGGLRKAQPGEKGITNYFGVMSVDETIRQIIAAGGSVLTGKQEVPGWGLLAVCKDPDGNTFGIFQETAEH